MSDSMKKIASCVKNHPLKSVLVVCLLMSILSVLSSPVWGQDQAGRIPVFVSIDPQVYFLERVGGTHVTVEVLIGKGHSPHTYEPTPQQTAKLAQARAFFGIGVPAEQGLLKKIKKTHRNLLMVNTQKGVPYRTIEGHDHPGEEAHHKAVNRKTPDPHIWMNPRLVKVQARNIRDALTRLDPGHARDYAANLRTFEADLDRIDARIARILAPMKGRKIYVFHPSFGYFTDAYGLVQVPIEMEGKEPSARQVAGLIERAKQDGVKVIFVQPQFSRKSAEAIAKAIGGTVVPIDPLARDYLANLEYIAVTIERGGTGKR